MGETADVIRFDYEMGLCNEIGEYYSPGRRGWKYIGAQTPPPAYDKSSKDRQSELRRRARRAARKYGVPVPEWAKVRRHVQGAY